MHVGNHMKKKSLSKTFLDPMQTHRFILDTNMKFGLQWQYDYTTQDYPSQPLLASLLLFLFSLCQVEMGLLVLVILQFCSSNMAFVSRDWSCLGSS